MTRRIKLLSLAAALVLAMCSAAFAQPGTAGISREKAVEIAGREAARLGYDPASKEVEVFKDTIPWYDKFPLLRDYFDCQLYYVEVKDRLEGKSYWAVYFTPKEKKPGETAGGEDVYIFVDSTTGEIIACLQGA